MDLDEARAFIGAHHRAILATMRGDGRPQMSPVTCAVDDQGLVVVSTRETAYKARNIARDPRVSLCVITDGFFGAWTQVDGTATILRMPGALDGLVDYYRRVSGEHPDWDDYRAAMARDRRVLVRVALERAGPTRSG